MNSPATTSSIPTAPSFPWLRVAPGFLLVLLLLLLFRETATAMVNIWVRSETFTHAFLVPPIVIWLIWRRSERLALTPAKPSLWALLPVAAACLLWVLGELASVNAATQFALVALIVLVVPTVYGWAVARELTFPLLFLFFAVPVGEFLVPQMMEWTADFTVAALQLSGIPVYREGLQFVIPSGNWSVVEACSGVRYLIASFMVGTLFGYLNFNSAKRRWLFVLVSLGVPVLANWLRAYLIVMIGHLSGNTLAAGVDHIIYGWVFFGIVIGVMFLVGARWAEPEAPLPTLAARAGVVSPSAAAYWVSAAAVSVLLVATLAGVWKLNQPSGTVPSLVMPGGANGWVGGAPSTQATGDWVPGFQNTSATAHQTYRSPGKGDAPVSLWVGYYRDQSYTRKLVTSTNALVEVVPEPTWVQAVAGGAQADTASGKVAVRTATLRGSAAPGAAATPRLRVWQFYWVGGQLTTSDARAKLRLALMKLSGQGDDGAVVLLYTPMADDKQTSEPDSLLADFSRDNLGAVVAALNATRATGAKR